MSWKPVPGFSGKYEVSVDGALRSTRTGKLLRPFVDKKGYVLFTLRDASKKKTIPAHRLVLSTFVGPRPAGMHGAHLDGDPSNNKLSNLSYVSPKDNEQHKLKHGTQCRGERSPNAKLTENQVREIIQSYKYRVVSSAALARKYGVHKSTIQAIVAGNQWRAVRTQPKEAQDESLVSAVTNGKADTEGAAPDAAEQRLPPANAVRLGVTPRRDEDSSTLLEEAREVLIEAQSAITSGLCLANSVGVSRQEHDVFGRAFDSIRKFLERLPARSDEELVDDLTRRAIFGRQSTKLVTVDPKRLELLEALERKVGPALTEYEQAQGEHFHRAMYALEDAYDALEAHDKAGGR